MTQTYNRQTHSFVLRLWQEQDGQLRGQLEHVGSHLTEHFQGMEGLQQSLSDWALGFVQCQEQTKEDAK